MAHRPMRAALDTQDRLVLRRAVAYACIPMPGFTKLQNTLMLSVYVYCHKYQSHERDQCWSCGARMHVPRSTPEKDQLLHLEALTYRLGLKHNRDFDIMVEALPKKPKECEDGIQRPFIE